jgi:hypothetical protein
MMLLCLYIFLTWISWLSAEKAALSVAGDIGAAEAGLYAVRSIMTNANKASGDLSIFILHMSVGTAFIYLFMRLFRLKIISALK